MNLAEELKKTAEGFQSQAPEQVQREMQKAHDELVREKILDAALGVGDRFPSFELNNQNNQTKKRDELFSDNHFLVVSF